VRTIVKHELNSFSFISPQIKSKNKILHTFDEGKQGMDLQCKKLLHSFLIHFSHLGIVTLQIEQKTSLLNKISIGYLRLFQDEPREKIPQLS
jgi:hypothetical protein